VGFSTNHDFNRDIALTACFAASWTPAMIRRWNADPFGFPRPRNEVPCADGERAARDGRGHGHLPDGVAPSTGHVPLLRRRSRQLHQGLMWPFAFARKSAGGVTATPPAESSPRSVAARRFSLDLPQWGRKQVRAIKIEIVAPVFLE
jgi:hypothetical protein